MLIKNDMEKPFEAKQDVDSKIHGIQTFYFVSLAKQFDARAESCRALRQACLEDLMARFPYEERQPNHWCAVFGVERKSLRTWIRPKKPSPVTKARAVNALSLLTGHRLSYSPLAKEIRANACVDTLSEVFSSFSVLNPEDLTMPFDKLTLDYWSIACALAARFKKRFSERKTLELRSDNYNDNQLLKLKKVQTLLEFGVAEVGEFVRDEGVSEILRARGLSTFKYNSLKNCHALIIPAMIIVISLEEFFALYRNEND